MEHPVRQGSDRQSAGAATETLYMYAFSQGFIESGKVSYASAMAVLMTSTLVMQPIATRAQAPAEMVIHNGLIINATAPVPLHPIKAQSSSTCPQNSTTS